MLQGLVSGVFVDEQFMRQAIELAGRSVIEGGGPFGAVIVKDGKVVGRGQNRVTLINDPTAHAEVQAIRDACRTLGQFHLDGCALYVNCQPCPMCFSAAYWAHIQHIYYAATQDDAAAIGFDDRWIAEQLGIPLEKRDIHQTQLLRDEALETFKQWSEKPDRIEY